MDSIEWVLEPSVSAVENFSDELVACDLHTAAEVHSDVNFLHTNFCKYYFILFFPFHFVFPLSLIYLFIYFCLSNTAGHREITWKQLNQNLTHVFDMTIALLLIGAHPYVRNKTDDQHCAQIVCYVCSNIVVQAQSMLVGAISQCMLPM